MSTIFGMDLKDLLSNEYDPSNLSPAKFREHWNALLKEQERLREALEEKNRELRDPESGIELADSNQFGLLSDGDPLAGITTPKETDEALSASKKNRKDHVRKLVEKIEGQKKILEKVVNRISSQRGRLAKNQKESKYQRDQKAGD